MFQSRALKFAQRAIFDNRTLFSLSSSFSTVSASNKQTSENQNRLSKIIATTGLCSRRQAEEWIKMGRVSVDGTICKSPSFIIDFQASVKSEEVVVEKDAERFDNNLRRHSILIDGVPLRWGYKVTNNPPKIWAIAKKKGEIVADKDDSKSRELVVERLKLHLSKETLEKQTSFKPIYRLEYETEGLLIFTNSGDLARAMQKDHVAFPIRYRVRVHGLITESKLSGLRKGLILSGVKYRPMEVSIERTSGTISWIKLTCSDPRSRAVRDCFGKLFLQITRLICVGFGPFDLEKLLPDKQPIAEVKITPQLSALYQRAQHKKIVNSRSTISAKKAEQDQQSK
eukprot:gene28744-37742_t